MKQLRIDLVRVNITYRTPHNVFNFTIKNDTTQNISNGINFTRNDNLTASALWITDNVLNATIEHNATGTFVNYSVITSFTGNWTNVTLNLTNYTQFPRAGIVNITAIYATDTFGQENGTSASKSFALLGDADARNITFSSPTSILNGSNVTIYCNVTDSNSTAVIPSYNVSFWKNNTLLGYNLTNSSGLASWLYLDTTSLVNSTTFNVSFNCSITNQPGIWYSASVSNTTTANLSIVEIEKINVTVNRTIYNRGESINFTVIDSLNGTVTEVRWTVNVTKFNQSSVVNLSGIANNFSLPILPSDPAGNWTVAINISKEGRTLALNYTFNVSASLVLTFTQPAAGGSYSANQIISDPNPQVLIRNVRNENLTYLVSANLTCPNVAFMISNGTGDVYQNTSQTCRAKDENGANFVLAANATDDFNNTGSANLALSTTTPSSGGSSGGGGGGGGGAGVPGCTCGEWVNQGCGIGLCSPDQMFQTRVCNPVGCNNLTSQCIAVPACLGVFDFNLTAFPVELELIQGSNESVILSVANTGDQLLQLVAVVDKQCCEVSAVPAFELLPKAGVDVAVAIRAPLTQSTGSYLVTFNLSFKSLVQTKAVKVTVLENALIPQIAELEQQLAALQETVAQYEEAGVSVEGLKSIADGVAAALEDAKKNIAADQPGFLEANLDYAADSINAAESQLFELSITKFLLENRWIILFGAIVILLATYLVAEILAPFIRMGREIMRLTREEKTLVNTRVETEKQYFKRIIDENTFNTILTEGQAKILKTRSLLTETRQRRASLLRERLSPRALGRWITRGIGKLKPRRTPHTDHPLHRKRKRFSWKGHGR